MDKKIFRYSLLWRITFTITVPLIFGLVLIYLENTGSTLNFNFVIILAALSFVPYSFLVYKFMGKYIAGEKQITEKNLFSSRTLKWKNIIEYRDFFTVIVLMPLVVRKSINIYFYRNIARYENLRSYFADRSRVYEANTMSRKEERIFLIIDIGILPVLFIVLASVVAVALFYQYPQFDLRVFLTAATSGILFVLSSVSIWIILHDLTQIPEKYSHIMATIMSITLIVPLIIIAGPVLKKDGSYFAGFLVTYILGYLLGWGGMSAFFPNREHKNPTGTGNKS